MELRELAAFVAVVEEGGLSAAARRLHVSQPAVDLIHERVAGAGENHRPVAGVE